MQQILNSLIQGENLTVEQAEEVMIGIMSGTFSNSEIAGFLTALAVKGETAEEIAGFARAMQAKMVKVSLESAAIDMCGTGGDGMGTFNISTAASFVVAGAGVPVAKHGNRSISSKSGSADVLSELGVDIQMPPGKVGEAVDEVGLGFLFAPAYHPAMKFVMPARKALGIRTVFNILGPLCNPAQVNRQVIGLFDGDLTEKMAHVLQLLGSKSAMLVHGTDGLDEISTTSGTIISQIAGNAEIRSHEFAPESAGIPRADINDLQGGTAADNAEIIRNILDGSTGPKRDVVILNAAAGLIVGGKVTGFSEGIQAAAESVDSGAAREVLARLVELS